MSVPNKERLQKVLASRGVASRRAVEQMIKDGRIRVNNEVAQLGVRVNEHDKIYIDGRVFSLKKTQSKTRVLLYHKPEGEICSRQDPEHERTVYDRLPRLQNARWLSIGRLDLNTSGLLLFTNDGDLANLMMHPSSTIEREYAIRVLGEVTNDLAQKLTEGIELDDGLARFEHIVSVGGDGVNKWYHAVVMEGRNRVVRRLFDAVGLKVSRLSRVRFGPIVLPRSVRPGKYQEFSADEITELLTWLQD